MFPKNIRLQVTPRCNQSCKHCFASSTSEVRSKELSDNEFLSVIDQIAGVDLEALTITGGEPLIRQKLVLKILERIKDLPIMKTINTNGWFLSESVARQLKQAGLDRAQISLDCVNPEEHDDFRGAKGAYKYAISAIENCVNMGIKTHVRATITSFNYDKMSKLLKLVLDKDAQRFIVKPFIPSGRGLTATEQLTYDQHRQAINDLIKYLKNNPDVSREQVQFLSPSFTFLISEEYAEFAEKCECGEELAFIAYNGDVQPCGYAHVVLGNLIDTPLKKIWAESPFLLKWRKTRLNEKCVTCKFAEICRGGCRAAAYETTGELTHPDPLCWLEITK